MHKIMIIEFRLLYVYLKSLLYSRRFWLLPLYYNIVFDISELRFFKLPILGRLDCFTIMDVFCYQHYGLKDHWRENVDDWLATSTRKPYILDLGSNLGFTSFYFQKSYPEAYIVGVEPNELAANIYLRNGFDDLKQGVIGKGKNAFISTATASYANKLSETGVLVKVIHEDELMEYSSMHLPLILKVDIEGAEEFLFGEYQCLVEQFKVIFVELHDWQDVSRIYSAPMWRFLAERDGKYHVLVKGDILCMIRNT